MQITQTTIIAIYKKISGFVFHYLVFLLIILLAVLILKKSFSQTTTTNIFQNNDMILMQKTKLMAEFNKFLKQNINDNDIKIYVLQSDFENDQGRIKSVNNLISYKGFVVPRYFYVYATLPVKQISYFSGNTYELGELENFVNNVVFTKKITVKKSLNRSQLPLNISLVDDFNLSCIFENKLSNWACNYYLNDFLDSFFIYNLTTDYTGLRQIFDAIASRETTKTAYCDTLFKYLLYTNDKSDTIKELFTSC